MHKKADIYANLCQLPLFGRDKAELLTKIKSSIENSSKLSYIVTPNPEQIILANSSLEYDRALNEADLYLPDGTGLVVARQWLSFLGKATSVPARIAGVDVVQDLLQLAAAQKYRVVVVGGRGYDSFLSSHPTVFTWLPAYDTVSQPTDEEEVSLSAALKELKPDIVLVALGAPWQELWVSNHRAELERVGVKVVMVVGGAIDFISGKTKRAPASWQKAGLEWLYRLIQEPWRWRRQLNLIKFIGLVIGASLFAPRLSDHSVAQKN
jgi:N-acetylglucosaminyldiphosphoundecaprenol N-acetyl-beta-D-mannosaminyltransferase